MLFNVIEFTSPCRKARGKIQIPVYYSISRNIMQEKMRDFQKNFQAFYGL